MGYQGKVRRDGCCFGPPVRRLLILVTRCHTWCTVTAVAVAGGTLPQSSIRNACMLINVALLAADGDDVSLTSPPCWWTRHKSTTVQRTRTRVQRRRRINRKKKVQSKVLKSKSSEVHKSEVKK